MAETDLQAVAVRRATLTRGLAGVEGKRAELKAEDKDLELTERVLTRLAQLSYAVEPITDGDAAVSETLAPSSRGALHSLMANALAAGRAGWGKIRSVVEKEVADISRHPR